MELRSKRLVLRPMRDTDATNIVSALSDYEVTRYLTVVPFPYSEADALEWIGMQKPAEPREATLAIELPGHGMIGAVGIGPGLGYWLDRRYHGYGYMTEASEALLEWYFASVPDGTLPSGAHVGNHASLNVQAKLGFVDTGIRDMRFVRSQRLEVEHVNTTVVRSDFETARRNLRSA